MSRTFHHTPISFADFRRRLDQVGWSYKTIERIAGVSPSTMRGWAKGEKPIPNWVPVFFAALQAPGALVLAKDEAYRLLIEKDLET